MGTGIVSILLYNLPWNARWLYWISVAIFCLNILLFVLFTAISVVLYTVFPGPFGAMLRHPVQSLFLGRFITAAEITFILTTSLGTIPMRLATIVNMTVFVCVPFWGPWAVILAWTLW